jgi:hypothetical protein
MPDEPTLNAFAAAEAAGTPFRCRQYNIHDWYWLADDGRVFSSARRVTVDTSDQGYQTFIEGGMATPWPRDDRGDQTDKALQDVFEMANFNPPINITVTSGHSSSHSKKK